MEGIIVTGANGFIGRYVKKELLNYGNTIFTIDREVVENEMQGVVPIATNLMIGQSVEESIKVIGDADVMVHLAADISVPGNALTIGNNIGGMCAAVEIANGCHVKHFVLLSTIPVIGNILYTPIDENHRVMPITQYHWSKYLCEKVLDDYMDFFETATVIRIPSPIGVGMRNNTYLPTILNKLICNDDIEVYGEGLRIQNYIDVRDVSHSIIKVIERKAKGLYLIGGEKSISNIELARLCKDITDSSSYIYTGLQPDKDENDKWVITYEKARKSFGYKPKYTLKESIEWIYEDMRRENK